MSKAATDYLADTVDRAVDYARREYEMTYAEAVGVLVMKAHLLMAEAADSDPEGDEDDEPR